MPLDSRTLQNDRFPAWAEEPPVPSEGSLVPGSQFHDEQWIMAAGMLARGNSFLQVSRAMGCSRTTLWRAYYGSKDFRHRVWWERQALNREAELRLSSLRILVAEQIERLVTSGDPTTVRWMAERLGLFDGLDRLASGRQAADRDAPPAPRPPPGPRIRPPSPSPNWTTTSPASCASAWRPIRPWSPPSWPGRRAKVRRASSPGPSTSTSITPTSTPARSAAAPPVPSPIPSDDAAGRCDIRRILFHAVPPLSHAPDEAADTPTLTGPAGLSDRNA